MKKILVVGCSFTGGMPENKWFSWTQHLADLTNYQVINMGLAGASIQTLSYLLTKGKEKFNPNFIIVQKTVPYRINFIDKSFNIDNYIIEKNQKYRYLNPEVRSNDKMISISPSNAHAMISTLKDKVMFANWYYKNFHTDFSDSDYNVHSDWLDYNSNFSFDTKYFGDLSNSEQTKLDKAGHLNQQGSTILAERVYNDIKRDIH